MQNRILHYPKKKRRETSDVGKLYNLNNYTNNDKEEREREGKPTPKFVVIV